MPVYHKLGLSLKKDTQFENQKEVLHEQLLKQRGLVEIGAVIPCSPTYTSKRNS
jgi:hypothetical protein